MITKAFKYYLLLIFALRFNAFAQQYNFKNYSAENGLPFVQVSSLHQDKFGYLWMAGYGGLSRFDGKNFLNFSPKNGLVNHYVNAVCSDDSGFVYAATADGLSIIKNNKIKNYNSGSLIENIYLNALCYDKKNGIYIGSRQGLFTFKNNKFSEIPEYKGLEIRSLITTTSGLVCVGTTFGLFYYNPIDNSSQKQKGLAGDIVNCIEECPETGHLLVGTTTGFSKILIPGEIPLNLHVENGLIDENITSILCEGPNSTWIGSASGLIKHNGKDFEYYNLYNDNNANHVR